MPEAMGASTIDNCWTEAWIQHMINKFLLKHMAAFIGARLDLKSSLETTSSGLGMDRIQPLRIRTGHLSEADYVQWHISCNYNAQGSVTYCSLLQTAHVKSFKKSIESIWR